MRLLYFDETGFSRNPPLQYGWTPIGQTRYAEAGAQRQRVNVLGALGHDGKLLWTAFSKTKCNTLCWAVLKCRVL